MTESGCRMALGHVQKFVNNETKIFDLDQPMRILAGRPRSKLLFFCRLIFLLYHSYISSSPHVSKTGCCSQFHNFYLPFLNPIHDGCIQRHRGQATNLFVTKRHSVIKHHLFCFHGNCNSVVYFSLESRFVIC